MCHAGLKIMQRSNNDIQPWRLLFCFSFICFWHFCIYLWWSLNWFSEFIFEKLPSKGNFQMISFHESLSLVLGHCEWLICIIVQDYICQRLSRKGFNRDNRQIVIIVIACHENVLYFQRQFNIFTCWYNSEECLTEECI